MEPQTQPFWLDRLSLSTLLAYTFVSPQEDVQSRWNGRALKALDSSSGVQSMLPWKIFDFHLRLNAISCILRALLAQNIVIKSNITLVLSIPHRWPRSEHWRHAIFIMSAMLFCTCICDCKPKHHYLSQHNLPTTVAESCRAAGIKKDRIFLCAIR